MAEQDIQPSLLSDYVHLHADERSLHTAFIDTLGRHYSYGQYERDSQRLAAFLLHNGGCSGQRIVYATTGTYQFFCLLSAASMTGALLVGLPLNACHSELVTIIRQTEPSLAFASEPSQEMLRQALDAEQRNECMILVSGSTRVHNSSSFTDALSDDSPACIARAIAAVSAVEARQNAETPLLIIYTSGSTGVPKGVVLTQRNILASARAQTRMFGGPDGCSPEDVFQHQVPVNHVSGTVEWGGAPLIAGCTSILAETFNPRRILQNTQNYRATILAGVPTMWNLMFRLPDFADYDLSSVRYCMNGAAPATREQLERMLAIANYCDNPLGLTETAGFCTYVDPLHTSTEQFLDTVGHVAEGITYQIVDDNFEPVPSGEVGQLAFRGDAVFSSYYRQQELTESAFEQGFFLSGDLAFEDRTGNIHLRGRNDDRYCCGAFNVYPVEAENALTSHPGIELAAVIPIPHRVLGSAGRAYVVPTKSASLSPALLKNYLKTQLTSYKIPQEFVIMDSLPLTSLGKPAKRVLKQMAAQESARNIESASADVSSGNSEA